jgi:hypothetical protein
LIAKVDTRNKRLSASVNDTDTILNLLCLCMYACRNVEFTLWVTDQEQHITSRDLGVAAYTTLVKVNDLILLMTSGNQLLDPRAK